jgi:hypothetical protein
MPMNFPERIRLSDTCPYLHGYTQFKPLRNGSLILICPICKGPITEFFFVPEEEWKQVTGKYKEYVICKKCYEKRKKDSGIYPDKN